MLFERFVTLVALIAISPLLVLIALAVVLDSGRPVFFRQLRVGQQGKPFRLFKFRSMKVNAAGPAITSKGDARVTRIGAILRNYKLDELPQLWNVVRGEMSLIGPVRKFRSMST
jgi:lipopolysaccharide/colanic/teichoic acid biosynthesis glycosyltransferase